MTAAKRAAIWMSGVALWLLVFGFVMFATTVMRPASTEAAKADGIVVLTGGETRIAEGARLLREGRAARMLISGVNKIARREQLLKLSELPAATFDCCVDLGYAARDTVGNADEARMWAEAKGYDSLIIVTASYHMPRSMAELAREMPGVRLIAHPVTPKTFRTEVWWLHLRTARTLASEYLKFLPAAARYGIARALGPWDARSVAAMVAPRSGT